MSDNRVLKIGHLSEVPGHSMYGDWGLPARPNCFVEITRLVPALIPNRKPIFIDHAEICAKPGNWFGQNDFSGPRFEQADTQYSGMIVRAMPNPCSRQYRMIDGRRRLEKMRRAGITRSSYFVFDYEEVLPYIVDFELVDQTNK